MADIILYLTTHDVKVVRDWLNCEPSIAWIIKTGQWRLEYRRQAVDTLEDVSPGEYHLWNKNAGPLNIPSGSAEVPDVVVTDPYAGIGLETISGASAVRLHSRPSGGGIG